MSIGIYKITSPTNRIYVGQSIEIETRWSSHTSKSVYLKSKYPLYNSFRKYGIDTHLFEILEICDESQLNERERYWQDLFDVLSYGLNQRLTTTSDNSGKLSTSHKKKISESMRGKNSWCVGVSRTDETKKRISETKRKNPYVFTEEQKKQMSESSKGQIPWNIGVSCSDETKLKIGKANKGYIHTKESIEKIRLSSIGRVQSAETKANRYVSRFCKQLSEDEKRIVFAEKLKQYKQ